MSSKKIKLKKIKSPLFSKAKGITSSKNFIITFTGRKAIIFNTKLELVYTIDDLYYVYNGYISPDESKVLLVSTSNRFYVFSLITFECLKRYILNGRFNYNLEGLGSWDFKNETFLICATDKNSLTSCVLQFDLYNEKPIKQIEFSNYVFSTIHRVEKLKKHILVGSNVKDAYKQYIVSLQRDCYEEYPIENLEDELVIDIEYNEILNSFIVYGNNNSVICNFQGRFIKPIDVDYIIKENSETITDWLEELPLSNEDKFKMLDKILDFIGSKNQLSYENINKLIWSENYDYIYCATSERLIIYNRENGDVIFSKEIPYGVCDVVEIDKSSILILTWNGIVHYEIQQK